MRNDYPKEAEEMEVENIHHTALEHDDGQD
jgi:hypothetical protein